MICVKEMPWWQKWKCAFKFAKCLKEL
jgi:hypothetical protein